MSDARYAELLDSAAKTPLFEPSQAGPAFDRAAIEATLPHRAPFLFLDSVESVDERERNAVGTLSLDPADPVFAGHFPASPVWPGVLQIEAIGQLGLFAKVHGDPERGEEPPALTQVLGARFLHPITPPARVTLLARAFEDGLFFIVVGQCITDGKICSSAAIRGL